MIDLVDAVKIGAPLLLFIACFWWWMLFRQRSTRSTRTDWLQHNYDALWTEGAMHARSLPGMSPGASTEVISSSQ